MNTGWKNIALDHRIGAGVFVPFVVARLSGVAGENEVILTVKLRDVGDAGERQRGTSMNHQPSQGIIRDGLNAAFEADEARKTTLILEARLHREQGLDEEAVAGFAEAARIEERLGQRCLEQSLIEKSFVHYFSAASCWAQAGNFYQAIALCNELLRQAELPERLRQRIQSYAHSIRLRRAHWYEELALETAAG